MLFASEAPLTPAEIARASGDLSPKDVEQAISDLCHEYEADDRSVQIYPLGDGYQILTRPEYAPYLERFKEGFDQLGTFGQALELGF